MYTRVSEESERVRIYIVEKPYYLSVSDAKLTVAATNKIITITTTTIQRSLFLVTHALFRRGKRRLAT